MHGFSSYRPEIDGLRAIAVTLVLLYHAGLGFPGGFVGVDVFFVISGFLITGIILKQLDSGTFSLKEFFSRRIRRILPASLTVVFVALVVGWALMVHADYSSLANSALSQQFMASNVYFLKTTDYFAGSAQTKPLLHYWSLAVEEQFYIVFPFYLLFLQRLGKATLFRLTLMLTIASLCLSELMVRGYGDATFFLLPPRAWELAVGALLAMKIANLQISDFIGRALTAIGLCLIFLASTMFTEQTIFPGLTATIPCAGAAFIICGTYRSDSLAKRIMSYRLIVYIGAISFSLYLWHWPVLAYLKYCLGLQLPWQLRSLAMVLAFGLAVVTYHFLENPLRHFKRASGHWNPIVWGCIFVSSLLVLCSVAIVLREGLPTRLPTSLQHQLANTTYSSEFNMVANPPVDFELQSIGVSHDGEIGPRLLVWGDSHAAALGRMLHDLSLKHGIEGKVAARPRTPPLIGVWRGDDRAWSTIWCEEVLAASNQFQPTDVLLMARWPLTIDSPLGESNNDWIRDKTNDRPTKAEAARLFEPAFERTVNHFRSRGCRVWILAPTPELAVSPAISLFHGAAFSLWPQRQLTLEQYRLRTQRVVGMITSVCERTDGAHFIEIAEACFGDDLAAKINNTEALYYTDDNHLSTFGAKALIQPVLEECFRTISSTETSE